MNEHDIADEVLAAAKKGNDGTDRLKQITEDEDLELVRLAVRKPDSNGATPMHWAATGDGGNMIDALSRLGGDEYARDKNGQAPIHWAVIHGAPFCVVRTLAKSAPGFNVENPYLLPDNNGNALLHLAMMHNREDVVEEIKWALLGRGAKLAKADPSILNARNKDDDAPLHLAADEGATDAIEELFERETEPDINVLDGNGNTPLDRVVKAQKRKATDLKRKAIDLIRGLGGKEGKP